MTPEHVKELEALVASWAQEKKILSQGEVLEINVKVISRPLVRIHLTNDDGNSSEHDEKPVTELSLSVRAQYFLTNNNIQTIGMLRRKSRAEIRGYRNIGNKTLRELQEKLHQLGIIVDWITPKMSATSTPVS